MTHPIRQYDDQVFDAAPGRGHMSDRADYVVIGTGPSGATAAKVLSSLGHDVIMIEEGRRADREEFIGHAFTSQKNFYREMGTIAATGKNVIPLIQGRCVGGGSVINAAIIWRTPEDVYHKWDERFQISEALAWSEMEDSFDAIERDLEIAETPEPALGRNNKLLKAGADKLGISSRIIPRNAKGCQGMAQCVIGCPVGAKKSVDLNYVPQALEAGARLYSSCRAHHIDVKRGRARTVHASFEDPLTGKRRGSLAAHADKGVIVCASPIQTPLLLWRSGLGLASGHLGRHLMGHPGSGVMCVYPDAVKVWEGATQGWDSEHYRQSDRVKFEALSITPDIMAGRVPGVGAEFKKAMHDYERLGNVGCALIAEAEGRVRPLGSGALITYSITQDDVLRLRKGMKLVAEIMFAAGAEEVLPGLHGLPPRITKDQLGLFDDAPTNPQSYTMVMTHLFSTARMGTDPKQSVVGPDFQLHDTRGVYVLDSSIFPTNIGVNPQHTIMAMAMAGARRIGS